MLPFLLNVEPSQFFFNGSAYLNLFSLKLMNSCIRPLILIEKVWGLPTESVWVLSTTGFGWSGTKVQNWSSFLFFRAVLLPQNKLLATSNPWRMSEFTCVQLLYICLNLLVLLTFLFSNCVFDLQSYKIQVYNIDSRFLFIVIHSIGYIPELYNISL